MSDGVTIEWDLNQIINQIQQMGRDIEAVEEVATKKASTILKEAVKRNLRRSNKDHKHMQDDIIISAVKTDDDGNRVREVTGGKKTGYKWKWLEFGTSKMHGNQFMTRSLQETADEVKAVINQEIQHALGL